MDESRRFKRFGNHYIDFSQVVSVYIGENEKDAIRINTLGSADVMLARDSKNGQQFLEWLKENTEE